MDESFAVRKINNIVYYIILIMFSLLKLEVNSTQPSLRQQVTRNISFSDRLVMAKTRFFFSDDNKSPLEIVKEEKFAEEIFQSYKCQSSHLLDDILNDIGIIQHAIEDIVDNSYLPQQAKDKFKDKSLLCYPKGIILWKIITDFHVSNPKKDMEIVENMISIMKAAVDTCKLKMSDEDFFKFWRFKPPSSDIEIEYGGIIILWRLRLLADRLINKDTYRDLLSHSLECLVKMVRMGDCTWAEIRKAQLRFLTHFGLYKFPTMKAIETQLKQLKSVRIYADMPPRYIIDEDMEDEVFEKREYEEDEEIEEPK